jgi:hypothetical protein
VKSRSDAPAGFFEVEAAGLRWLAVPGVLFGGGYVAQAIESARRY